MGTIPMRTSAVIIFSFALVPYILSWKYILQFIRDVNSRTTGDKVSVWTWYKGWRIHGQFFPTSSVRRNIVSCIALTVSLGLIAFCVGARNLYLQP
jgi:hypothetical protein